MKRKRGKAQTEPKWRFVVRYSVERHGWVIDGAPGRQIVFATKMDAENHCIHKLHTHPTEVLPKPTTFQDLPHSSVWTGAPWDKTFKHIRD
ncbi:MAG TPA: hypothetical protein VG347_16730 [Verrucomicrobiae bacterium]|nr:hypothetical protein [Verrucomicrobiae bacterium]